MTRNYGIPRPRDDYRIRMRPAVRALVVQLVIASAIVAVFSIFWMAAN